MTTVSFTLDDLSEPAPPPGPADWNDDGVAIYPDMIPNDLIYPYANEWRESNGFRGISLDRGVEVLLADNPGGYDETAYMRHPALFDLCTYGPLADALESLIGEPAGVHLNLSGWVSTERDWHQDTYLNPAHVGDSYAAVWMALGYVHPDSGPFQYVPGSHRWHKLTREKIGRVVDLADPMWPKHSEDALSPLVTAEIERRGAELVTYLPKRGDVLIWHSRLYHRGSKAVVPGAFRPALIAHYSGINHRQDMPAAQQAPGGGFYFPLGIPHGAHAAMRRA
jgi:hypothetical protein